VWLIDGKFTSGSLFLQPGTLLFATLFVTNVLILRNEAHFTSALLVANANCVQLCGIQIARSHINPPVMKHFHQK